MLLPVALLLSDAEMEKSEREDGSFSGRNLRLNIAVLA
jgi:hypothetical protein